MHTLHALGFRAGRMRREETHPAVGDRVAASLRRAEGSATIHAVLPRQSALCRAAAGTRGARQVVGANVDTAFLLCALDGDFNLRRLERYLVMAWEGGARPVVVLNKVDRCDAVERRLEEVRAVAPGVPVHPICALSGDGVDALAAYLASGETVALLGSSGVGKSTLTNRLAGTRLATQEVRADDDRGRHTTTRREPIVLEAGGILMDTPGMRELHLWDGEEELAETFAEVAELAAGCRFRDCRHECEPACAVRAALEDGRLAGARFAGFRKLERELRHQSARHGHSARLAEKRRVKTITRAMRERSG